MRWGAALIGAALAAFASDVASAKIRISGDYGGQIGTYLERYRTMRAAGEQVIIDGSCLSACTLVLGMVPREHICVTSRARLGFHAAWRKNDKTARQVAAADGTQLLMETYPPEIRSWIAQRGGLTTQVIYLSGRELAAMYPACK
jgi:hypothetical protein